MASPRREKKIEAIDHKTAIYFNQCMDTRGWFLDFHSYFTLALLLQVIYILWHLRKVAEASISTILQ